MGFLGTTWEYLYCFGRLPRDIKLILWTLKKGFMSQGFSQPINVWNEDANKLSWTNISSAQPGGELGEFAFFFFFEDALLFWGHFERGFISLRSSLLLQAVCQSGSSIWVVFDAVQQAVCLGYNDQAVTSPEQENEGGGGGDGWGAGQWNP